MGLASYIESLLRHIPWPPAWGPLARPRLASLAQKEGLQKIRLWDHFAHAWGMTFFPTLGKALGLAEITVTRQLHDQLRVEMLTSPPSSIPRKMESVQFN